MRERLVGAIAAVALALVGCGGDEPDRVAQPVLNPLQAVVAERDGLDGPARSARLLELAKAETGPFTVFTQFNTELASKLEGGFEEIAGVDVTLFRSDTEGILTRLSQERAAGQPTADVVTLDGISMGRLDRDGVLEPHGLDGPNLVPGSVRPTWVALSLSSLVVAWNTDRVSPAEAPKAWEDLADPSWNGRLAMELSDWQWYVTLRDHWIRDVGKSAEEADRLFEAMVANARLVKGHTLMGQLLAAGEVDVAASQFIIIVERDSTAGAPVAWRPPVLPVVSGFNGAGVVVGSARPATALLFLEWVIGPGQEVFLEANAEPTRVDLAGTEPVDRQLVDVDALAGSAQEWSDRYDRLVSSGRTG